MKVEMIRDKTNQCFIDFFDGRTAKKIYAVIIALATAYVAAFILWG